MMRKPVSLLAVMLVACPAVVVTAAAYTDTFDNAAAPDQSWVFQDETGATEAWISGVGQALNAAPYTVSFGGTATVSTTTIPPLNVTGILSTFDGATFTPVSYSGGLTVSGLLNANGTANTTDQALAGFLMDNDSSGYQEAYLLVISPVWHDIGLYVVDEIGDSVNQKVIRLTLADQGDYSGQPGEPLMDIPVECTMQIETITSGPDAGNVRLSAVAYGDYDGDSTVTKLAEMSFIAGVDTPYPNGHNPPGSYESGDVPVILGGTVGFAGIVSASVPNLLNVSLDDFHSWDALSGDFDLDGDVDGDDFLVWQGGFGIGSGATRMQGDADADGDVDGDDFLLWQGQFGSTTGSGSLATTAVPEPAAMALLLVVGAMGVFSHRLGICRTRP